MFVKIFDSIVLVLTSGVTVTLGIFRFVILPYMNAHADVFHIHPVNDVMMGVSAFGFIVCVICTIICMIPSNTTANLTTTIEEE